MKSKLSILKSLFLLQIVINVKSITHDIKKNHIIFLLKYISTYNFIYV